MAGKAKKAKKAAKRDGKKAKARRPMPAVIAPKVDAPRFLTEHGPFDLDDPALPEWVEREALPSDNYPYDAAIKEKIYEAELTTLQIELVKLQRHANETGLRMVLLFEGRDAAGKGGSIFTFRQYLNPRSARAVALPKPTESEAAQWYFQRYTAHLPTGGEIVLFDRSWYNRAGVEPVIGFCTALQHKTFLRQAPSFEKMLVEAGILVFKFWLDIGRAMQLKRFHERRHNPLKIWKLSPMDYAAMAKWDAYTAARDEMFAATHTEVAPWIVVRANDKRRAHLNIIRYVLGAVEYEGRDSDAVRRPDPLILGAGPGLLGGN
jgi:polyphosphate kinase 2